MLFRNEQLMLFPVRFDILTVLKPNLIFIPPFIKLSFELALHWECFQSFLSCIMRIRHAYENRVNAVFALVKYPIS